MSSTLARTDRRLGELQAVADGERSRLYFSKGPWLVGTTGNKVEAGQARTLTELMGANLIMTTRPRWNGPIMAELTVAGREALQAWRTEPTGDAARSETEPEECGCADAGQCLTSTGCEHCRVYGDESCGLEI